MKDTLENKLSMYQKVQGFMELHATDISSIPSLVTLQNSFNTNVSAILSLSALAHADITGYTVEKQVKRSALKNDIITLSTAVVAHAAMTDNYALLEKCDESPSAVDAMRDNDFYTYSQLVINAATPIMTSLEPFGVTAAHLSSAVAASELYLTNIQTPKVQINERSRSNSDIEILFEETDTLLKNKLDKVMKIFIVSNASLYNGYSGARGIEQTGPTVQPDYTDLIGNGETKLIATIPFLAGRTFEFENTGTAKLLFALSATPDTMEGTVLSLDPGQYAVRKSANLNPDPTADKLYIQNTDASLQGSYKVWVVE